MARNLAWALGRLLAAVAGLAAAYLIAALIGSSIPANIGWEQAREGVRIYVIDNGVHTDLVLPVAAEGVDWRERVHPEDLADPRMADHPYLTIGWGDRDFYLNTPSWSAMRLDRAASALAGLGRTVLHISYIPEPSAARDTRVVTLRADEYRRLVAYVRAGFAEGPSVRGYGANDAFYESRGAYSLFATCNQWTGRALRTAGVRMGLWTPFALGVMQWL